MNRISNIKCFLYFCSIFSLITISACGAQRSIEFNNNLNGKPDQIKVFTPNAKTLAKLDENFKEEYKTVGQDDYSYMHGITDCNHVLMVMLTPEIKKLIKDTKDRPRETRIKNIFGWLEEKSGNKLKVITFYSLSLNHIKFLSNFLFQIFKKHWHNYNGKDVYSCLSTIGFFTSNFPICQIVDDVEHCLAIYENPYMRYYFENLGNSDLVDFTIEMASEYPVPLPNSVHRSEQQKQFQIYTDVNQLHQKQQELLEFTRKNRIPHFHYLATRARVIPLMENAKTRINEIRKSKFELIIDDFRGDEPERIKMSCYKLQFQVNKDTFYIPDPEASEEIKNWTYLKDTTSTKYALLVVISNKMRQTLDGQYNGEKKSEIYSFVKLIKKVSNNVIPILIYVKGVDLAVPRFYRVFKYWIEYHRQKADTRDTIEYVLIMDFVQLSGPITDIIDRPYAFYENSGFRYALNHLSNGYWLELDNEYALPIPTPADAWNDPNQELLQKDLKTELSKLQKKLEMEIEQMIKDGKKLKFYKDSQNVEGGSKRVRKSKAASEFRFEDETAKTHRKFGDETMQPSSSNPTVLPDRTQPPGKPIKIIDHFANQAAKNLMEPEEEHPPPNQIAFVDETIRTARHYQDDEQFSVPSKVRRRDPNAEDEAEDERSSSRKSARRG